MIIYLPAFTGFSINVSCFQGSENKIAQVCIYTQVRLNIFYVQSKNRLLDDEVAIYKNVTPGSGPVSSKADLFPSGEKTLFSWKSNEYYGIIKCPEPYLAYHSRKV